MKELCHPCQAERMAGCRFEALAEHIATNVPPLNRQNLLRKDKPIMKEAFAAHRTIAEMRKKAEQRGCPYSDKVNPDYPGKKSN